jgi:integrase
MASVFFKDGSYYVRWKDAAGHWRRRASACRTKRDALHEAQDLERHADRQAHGLEALPSEAPSLTFGQLLDWWWKDYGSKLRSPSVRLFAEKHLRQELGQLPLIEVTAAKIEGLLVARDEALSPKSLNHLRGLIHRLFSLATRRGLWFGPNPVSAVPRRNVPRVMGEVLSAAEVAALFAFLPSHWQPVFACAIWTGMRKGELLGLQKTDVDLENSTLTIRHSYASDTTKGSHADAIPIAVPLVPFLRQAILASRSELVFPAPDGLMRSSQTPLEQVLRRAMVKAGIVRGWAHSCRRCKSSKAPHVEQHRDSALRHCPKCQMKLWPRALVRPVGFKDLRATTATLLARAGVPLVVAQRVLRHSDPRLTSNVYSRIDLGDMRDGVNRIPLLLAVGAEEARLVPPVSRKSKVGEKRGRGAKAGPKEIAVLCWSGRQDLNLRPLGPEPSALPG